MWGPAVSPPFFVLFVSRIYYLFQLKAMKICRKIKKSAKNVNLILLSCLERDLQNKNTYACEMSLLPLLKIQFVFKLVYLIPVVLLV